MVAAMAAIAAEATAIVGSEGEDQPRVVVETEEGTVVLTEAVAGTMEVHMAQPKAAVSQGLAMVVSLLEAQVHHRACNLVAEACNLVAEACNLVAGAATEEEEASIK